jgi:hypothetical protein
VILSGAGLLVGLAACLGLMADPDGERALYYVGPLFLFVAAAYFAPAFVGGVGLLRGAFWGKVVIGALSALLLLAIPVGTLLGGFGLWILAKSPPRPVTPATAFVPRAPGSPPPRILGLLVAASAVGCAFIVVLGAGFRLHQQIPPEPLESGFYPALVVLAAIVAFVVVKRPFAAPPRPQTLDPITLHRLRTKMRAEQGAWELERRRRITELATDPARRKYAEQIEAGQSWNDAQIAYDIDAGATATCRHLKPIEAAMRQCGVEMKLQTDTRVSAECRIDEPALKARFQPARSVHYAEAYMGGRAAEDDPVAFLRCEACESIIATIHPDVLRSGGSVFPA